MSRQQMKAFGARRAVTVFGAVLLLTSHAAAQPALEISGGYMRLEPNQEYWDGWFGDAAFPIGDWWKLVGEVGKAHRASTWSLRPPDVPSLVPHTLSIDRSIYHFLGGPRFSLSRRKALEPFAQALLGLARWSTRGTAIGGASGLARDYESNVTDSSTGLTVQPGAGATLRFGRLGVRAAVDYRRTFLGERSCTTGCVRAFQTESRGDDTFRVSVGGVTPGSIKGTSTTTAFGRSTTVNLSEETAGKFTFDIGAGMTLNVIDAAGIRISGSYLQPTQRPFSPRATNGGAGGVRFGAGIVLPF